MVRTCRNSIAGILVGLAGSGVLCLPAFGREVRLTIRPQKAPADPGQYSLLPPSASLIEGDAVALYEQAMKGLPTQAGADQIRQWLGLPVGQLPLGDVEAMLQRHAENLRSAAKAARCKECKWPAWTPGAKITNDREYRVLAWLIELWARYEMAHQGYEGAVVAMQTGFGMARHLGQGPTIMQGLIGAATGATMCREIEQFIEGTDSPNLYHALTDMAKPLIEIDRAIENEKKASLAEAPNEAVRQEFEKVLKPAHDRSRLVARRLDANLSALQCVEAIRAYAASHAGQLPASLSDVTELAVPADPITGEPFRYTVTASTATLESPLPPDADKRDGIQYEISVKN
jgi:hypothetical protein